MPPAPADLVGDLEVFQGILDLALCKPVDVYLGLRVGVGCQAGAV